MDHTGTQSPPPEHVAAIVASVAALLGERAVVRVIEPVETRSPPRSIAPGDRSHEAFDPWTRRRSAPARGCDREE
jgi:hypothetical protein